MFEELYVGSAEDNVLNEAVEQILEASEDVIGDGSTDIDIVAGITDEDIPDYDETEDDEDYEDDEEEVVYAIPESYESDDEEDDDDDDEDDEDDDDEDDEDEEDDDDDSGECYGQGCKKYRY